MLTAICWVGMIASLLLVINVWPRGMLLICFVCFLSFVSAAQDFSGYQSDGMLLEAGFISLFFAPPGFWPGLGRAHPPSRASLFPAAMGVVSHLLRIGHGEAGQRRSPVAQLYRHGRVLPERPAAHLDWLVCAAPAALGSRLRHRRHAGARTGTGVHAVSATALADRLLLHCDGVADPGDPDRELHVPELPRAAARISAAGRSLSAADHAATLEATRFAAAEYSCKTTCARSQMPRSACGIKSRIATREHESAPAAAFASRV